MLRCAQIISLSILCFAGSVSLFAQTADSAAIQKMSNYLALKLSMTNHVEQFNTRGPGYNYQLRPNDNTALKLSVNYRFLSFSVKTTPGFIKANDDDTLRGPSKYIGYSLSLNFDRWQQELSYNRAKGFYLSNTSQYVPGWVEGADPYIQFPDLVYTGFHGRTSYKFNRNFSFNALSSQTERQLRSAGTLMPSLAYNYYIIDNKVELTGQNSSQKSNNFDFSLSVAYFHTFVVKQKFYFSAGAAPGVGMVFTKLLTCLPAGSQTDHFNGPLARLDLGMAIGYNSTRFFLGAQVLANTATYKGGDRSNVIIDDQVSYQLFAGYRFNAPAFLNRLVDQLEEKKNSLLKSR